MILGLEQDQLGAQNCTHPGQRTRPEFDGWSSCLRYLAVRWSSLFCYVCAALFLYARDARLLLKARGWRQRRSMLEGSRQYPDRDPGDRPCRLALKLDREAGALIEVSVSFFGSTLTNL